MYLFQGISWMQKRSPLQVAGPAMWYFYWRIQYSTKIWKRDWLPSLCGKYARAMVSTHKSQIWSFSTTMYALIPPGSGAPHWGKQNGLPLSEKGKWEKTNSGYALEGSQSWQSSLALVASCCRIARSCVLRIAFWYELVIDKMKAGKSPNGFFGS